jgi:hypothetical protein
MSQPMGNSGVEVDFLTGRPLADLGQERAGETRERLAAAQAESWRLREELARDGGAVLRALEQAMTARAEAVLAQDDQYQALAQFAHSLGLKVRVLPALVERELARKVGEDLYKLTRQPRTAPERDTGREEEA